MATLAAEVPGSIASLDVEGTAPVHSGDIIATIDDGDYKIAVDAASAKTRTQRATIDRLGQQIAAQPAAVEQAKAQFASAKAGDHARKAPARPPAVPGDPRVREPPGPR